MIGMTDPINIMQEGHVMNLLTAMWLEPCNGYMNNTFSKGRFQEKKGAGNNYQKAE